MPAAEGSPQRRWRLVRAGSDAIPQSVRRFMSRTGQRRLLSRVPWRLAGLSLVTLCFFGWVVLVSPVLGVRAIEVSGADLLSPAQISQAAQLRTGTPLARLDLDGARDRVSALPSVEWVTIERSWPSTVRIVVRERTPVAAVAHGDQFLLLDRHGVGFRTVAQPPAEVVRVRLGDAGDAQLQDAALTVIAALTPELAAQLVTLVVDAPARIRLELREDRTVTWGDSEQSEYKAKVATALLAQSGQRIDVSAPEVVTVR